MASTRTTGNDDISGVDPGGTRSTRPGQADKTAPPAAESRTETPVTSGDRNAGRPEDLAKDVEHTKG